MQRLIAVLSVPSIGRSALLHDKAPCFAKEVPAEDKAVLLSAGWTEEDGLRALLNFSGLARTSGCTREPALLVRRACIACASKMTIRRLRDLSTQ